MQGINLSRSDCKPSYYRHSACAGFMFRNFAFCSWTAAQCDVARYTARSRRCWESSAQARHRAWQTSLRRRICWQRSWRQILWCSMATSNTRETTAHRRRRQAQMQKSASTVMWQRHTLPAATRQLKTYPAALQALPSSLAAKSSQDVRTCALKTRATVTLDCINASKVQS